ncbi:hypothetical protein AF74_08975 [Aliarcobacter butzleri L349]|nr:hypothetical protein AF74_08975 [Aliarcobacter butzleri L349]
MEYYINTKIDKIFINKYLLKLEKILGEDYGTN